MTHNTSGKTILNILVNGPMFAKEISNASGIPTQRILDCCGKMLGKELGKRLAELPEHLRKGQRKLQQWQWYLVGSAPPASSSDLPPMKPLQGRGLFGPKIVMRPGSEWALREPIYVSMDMKPSSVRA